MLNLTSHPEMQIELMKFHCCLTRLHDTDMVLNVGERVKQLELSYTAPGRINLADLIKLINA